VIGLRSARTTLKRDASDMSTPEYASLLDAIGERPSDILDDRSGPQASTKVAVDLDVAVREDVRVAGRIFPKDGKNYGPNVPIPFVRLQQV